MSLEIRDELNERLITELTVIIILYAFVKTNDNECTKRTVIITFTVCALTHDI